MTTVAALLAAASGRLAQAAEAPRREAELLLGHVLGRDRAWLFAWPERVVEEAAAVRFRGLVARRAAGEPIAYLTGRREFWSLDLEVTPATLIPRPDTETLVAEALARLPADAPRLADLGTGSGAIALAIAHERPDALVVATDASPAAAAVARRNASRLGLANVLLLVGDWLDPLADGRFDLIASNPPYIHAADPHLSRGDLRFEPAAALSDGADGLGAIRAIVADAPRCLRPGGWLLLEHGYDQAEAVAALLREGGFADVFGARDLAGLPRVTGGRWNGREPAKACT